MMNKDLYKSAVDEIVADERIVRELSKKMIEEPVRLRRKTRYGILSAAAVLLLIAVIALGNNNNLISGNRIAQLNTGVSITLPQGKGTLYINKIEGMTSSKLFIPEGAYSKDYTLEQLTGFFGRGPLPKIPDGYKAESDSTNITFDPQGKMLFMSTISYSMDIDNPDASSIDIKMNKDALPPKDCLYSRDTLKESTIGSTKVVIGAISMEDMPNDEGKASASYNVYSAEFIYNNIGYSITAKRTDGQTFIDLLESIIK